MTELPTIDQAEDAAAEAMASLLWDAMDACPPSGVPLLYACRELLRGPLAEDYSRRPGGYCLRAPRDPRLAALLHAGALIAELAYTVRDPERAIAEAAALIAALEVKS